MLDFFVGQLVRALDELMLPRGRAFFFGDRAKLQTGRITSADTVEEIFG